MTSISVSSMPLPCAHCISAGISSSLRFFSATALILTRKARRARRLDAGQHLVDSPQRVMARKLSRIQRVERDVDPADAAIGEFACEVRQQRAVGGERQFIQRAAVEMPRQRAHQRHHVAADERLAAGQPQLPHALGDEGRAQPVEFFQRQQVGFRQERHVFRHAIEAAQIAAVGHRHAQIVIVRPNGSVIGRSAMRLD